MMLLRNRLFLCVFSVATVWLSQTLWAQDRVSRTVHNLSSGGPGQVRAQSEAQVCVFCHAPHRATAGRPLWNREFPVSSYQIYQSSTLDARPGQPTGASKLCLSCHDGTIALGRVLSRTDRIRMMGGDFMPAGLSNLGTDLSDDHPVSFQYTSGLAMSDPQLANPAVLPSHVKRDSSGQLQCTTCHDPHHNLYGKFLVETDEFGTLCMVCHIMDGWMTGSHQSASAAVSGALSGDWPYQTVAENACRSCHRPHSAGGRERLLILENEEDNCLNCHDGRVAGTNILAELNKISVHDPRRYLDVHDPVETPASMSPHVECADCHNPHAVAPETGHRAYVPMGATMSQVHGVSSGGGFVEEARYEYEVCFRCHGDAPVPVQNRIPRQVEELNLRLEFSPTSPSFHPVVASSASGDTVSLVPGLAPGSMIRCTDCHNNNAGPRAGGSGPDGPHGSVYDFLLERNYTVLDNTGESAFEYAMCYKCHERTSILNNDSFGRHRQHLRGASSASCSACHDPHGVSLIQATGSDHTHLINFDTTIVFPDPQTGVLEFRDDGTFEGSCTLLCHGKVHRDAGYSEFRGSASPDVLPGGS